MPKWLNRPGHESVGGFAMSKGRLRPEFLDRIESFSDRCIAVAESLASQGRFARLVEQLACSGASVGANIAEADEAMSTKDFRKSLSISLKELVETQFWLRIFVRRQWLREAQIASLLQELEEIKLILGSIIGRTKAASERPTRRGGKSASAV